MIVILTQALALVATAALPSTPTADRGGLLLGGGLASVVGAVWFLVVPRELFGQWRVFVAALIALVVMLLVLATTGGLASIYFPYYLVPLLVMIMAGSRERTIVLGVAAVAGLMMLALAETDREPDLVAAVGVRVIEVATFALASAAASRAMGAVRGALTEQTRLLADQARTDPMTGLGNRKGLEDEGARLRAATLRRRTPLSLVSIDIDGLKTVNDRMGHATGDDLLKRFAAVLRSTVRGQDVALRLGGDEFALLLPDTEEAGARRLVERIREASGETTPRITFSAGIAVLGADETISQLLAEADTALYREKALHRSGAAAGAT